jgi:hypothetical protein
VSQDRVYIERQRPERDIAYYQALVDMNKNWAVLSMIAELDSNAIEGLSRSDATEITKIARYQGIREALGRVLLVFSEARKELKKALESQDDPKREKPKGAVQLKA